MFRYRFVEWSQLALADVVLCMNRGKHYRLVRYVDEILAAKKHDGTMADFRNEYWVGLLAQPTVAPLKPAYGRFEIKKSEDEEYIFDDWQRLGDFAYLHVAADGYKWSAERLRVGDVITDGERNLRITRHVEQYTPFMDYGMTGREPPHNDSYFEYIDDVGQIGKIHDGSWKMFSTPILTKYPVLI